jgi:hypothetical protein
MTRIARPAVPPHANAKTHARVMRTLSKATERQLVQSLVDAKIIGINGKLTAPYRAEGTPRNGTAKRKHSRATT